jgi:hypothetical protein
MSDPRYDNWFTDTDQLQIPTPGLKSKGGPAYDRAIAIIKAFANRNGGSPFWKQLNRYAIAKDIEARLKDPDTFNQGQTWLCGIATFARVWAIDCPEQYAQLAVDLFEKGQGTLIGAKKYGGKIIKPSKTLLESPAGDQVSHGDWIVLASIREAFNQVFDYQADEGLGHIRAWNFPSDVVGEFKATGYSRIISKAGLSSGGVGSLDEASTLFDDGWRVILLVHSDIVASRKASSSGPAPSRASIPNTPENFGKIWRIDKGPDTPPPIKGQTFRTSDHWIGLNSSITISRWGAEWMVQPFQVYSWDGKHTVPGWKAPVPLSIFNDYYFGYVAAKF